MAAGHIPAPDQVAYDAANSVGGDARHPDYPVLPGTRSPPWHYCTSQFLLEILNGETDIAAPSE